MSATAFESAVRSLDKEWMSRAACRDMMPLFPSEDIFFAEANSVTRGQLARIARGGAIGRHAAAAFPHSIRKAKQVCARCPVRRECLAWAFAMDDQWGIFGGQTPMERAAMGLRSLPLEERIDVLEERFREQAPVLGIVRSSKEVA